ncbi:MAG: hypothetical protein OIF40_00480 [Mangrovicoccus sp.]|nr:hypothetical protein [Mangrovicoccus sp.]
MKTAAAVLAIMGGAGGLSLMAPGATAPLHIATASLQDPDLPGITDWIATYAAPAPMGADQIAAWARSFERPYPGQRVLLIYAPGQPVPDPSPAQSFHHALWMAQSSPAHWRVDLSAHGRATISKFDHSSQVWQKVSPNPG